MTRDEAKQWIMDGERACLPPGAPLPFNAVSRIISARKSCVVAAVEMFDGRPGTIEVSQQKIGDFKSWGLYWKDLPGGAANWNGTHWERVNSIIQPKQLEFELEEAGTR